MKEDLIMWIWGIGLLSISWSTIKTFRDDKGESSIIIKAVALVLTIAFAPILAILQGIWAIKL